MADSMCGPSNALQNFQKQSAADRSLQQDRLVNRAPQSQGFRSQQPIQGNAAAEFDAFQAGQLPMLPESQGFMPGPAQFHQAQRLNQPGPANWANDFQNLSISQPGLQHQKSQGQLPSGASWHQEFAQHQGMASHGHSTPVERLSSIQAAPYGGMTMPMYQSPMMMNQGMMQQPVQPPQMQAPATTEAFDEEAFARAFDQAAEAEMSAQLSQGAQLSQELQDHAYDNPLNEERIGADAIHHPDDAEYKQMSKGQESDDLARTAGQLLNSVADNQSDKFQQSVFLQLMRQFRDKEVVVDGDHIVPADHTPNEQPTPINRHKEKIVRPPPIRTNSEEILSKSYTAFSPINLYSPQSPLVGDGTLPRSASVTHLAASRAAAQNMTRSHSADISRAAQSAGRSVDSSPDATRPEKLTETKRKFKGLKVQFEDMARREREAKEELKREALRAFEDELRIAGRTSGEPLKSADEEASRKA